MSITIQLETTNRSYERRTTEVKSKKQSTLKRLMVYAGKYRYFTYASCILAAISAAIALIPFMIYGGL